MIAYILALVLVKKHISGSSPLPIQTPPTARAELYMAIAFLAAAIMALELVQVRILSSLYFNQIVYFTVTIALMGFGLAGVVLSLMSHRGTPPFHWIMQFTALFSVSSLLCLSYVSHIPVWYPHQSQLSQTADLILVVPFFCGGMAVGLLLLS